jgi:hypothetical protein
MDSGKGLKGYSLRRCEMTPEEYLEFCVDPSVPVGYTFCCIEREAKVNGWTINQVVDLKNTVESRYRESARFVFPRKVRYV